MTLMRSPLNIFHHPVASMVVLWAFSLLLLIVMKAPGMKFMYDVMRLVFRLHAASPTELELFSMIEHPVNLKPIHRAQHCLKLLRRSQSNKRSPQNRPWPPQEERLICFGKTVDLRQNWQTSPV